jgi:hypothetical protein
LERLQSKHATRTFVLLAAAALRDRDDVVELDLVVLQHLAAGLDRRIFFHTVFDRL